MRSFGDHMYSYNLRVVQMFIYKFNVLEGLKEAGYNTTRLRKEKLLGEKAIQLSKSNNRASGGKENRWTKT